MTHERRVFLRALLAGLPAVAVALVLLWAGDFTPKVRWSVALLAVGWWLAFAGTIGERVVRPLQSISNLLAALREGDYSIRARGARTDEALGLALWEVNALADVLRGQRLGALEATALLRRVIAEVDVAIFTFDQDQRLRVLNRAGERFLGQGAARALGRTAGDLGLAACLEGEVPRTVELPFGGRLGRWEIRRSAFRQDGRPHQLVVLSDLSRALREEERQAWQRLIRVLGHEINNSLAPIQSIAKSLGEALDRGQRPGTAGPTQPADSAEDFRRGLAVIAARSESLSRFMAAYSRLARLPRPTLAPVDLPALVRRVAGLETRLSVRIGSQSALSVAADADQLEQLLINLVSNAVDAALETGGGVNIGWDVVDHAVEVRVEDEGPGIPETANLFVPFYTTKPEGSGIGLVLSRQIAEAHGGTLTLENRAAGRGCVARLTLPV
ncbi:MAG: PAS domain-containing sensor histidine kinase [Gemmatimonadetes bacterium]|nr:PAS domain-containing sensor histidine kinase [Gemmatimonadota bacterium]